MCIYTLINIYNKIVRNEINLNKKIKQKTKSQKDRKGINIAITL